LKITVIHKDIATWSNKDFLIYFSNRLKELTGSSLDIPPVAWAGFLSRIKGFRKKLNLDNFKYKKFIDSVFVIFFNTDGYTPAFGAIVSERVFYVVNGAKNTTPTQQVDWKKLRDELYKNNLLFQGMK